MTNGPTRRQMRRSTPRAFADKVFSINQDDAKFKVNADVTPQEMYRSGWKCAGTAVPVFSLRTEDSFGIGDFHDLKKLADWVAATGQRVIQLLPVNDTTMTGTWKDSYPYSANSIYALHPQFVYLPDAGVRRDAKYKALKAELEALAEIDYERVNQEKDRLMRKAFASTWEKVSGSSEYKEFLKDNAGWLDAYCAFRILLHKTGTGDSTKWGKYATYSAKKAAAVLAENREEADYQSSYSSICTSSWWRPGTMQGNAASLSRATSLSVSAGPAWTHGRTRHSST